MHVPPYKFPSHWTRAMASKVMRAPRKKGSWLSALKLLLTRQNPGPPKNYAIGRAIREQEMVILHPELRSFLLLFLLLPLGA
jgi:hypothetical protein